MNRTECQSHIMITVDEEEKEIIETFRNFSEDTKKILKRIIIAYQNTEHEINRKNIKILRRDNT